MLLEAGVRRRRFCQLPWGVWKRTRGRELNNAPGPSFMFEDELTIPAVRLRLPRA